MHVLFEELSAPQRAGGVEAATRGLAENLAAQGVTVTRCLPEAPVTVNESPDCVHIHGIWSPALVLRFMHWRRRGIPCVVTVHGMLEPWALAHKRLKKRVAWFFYQKRLLNQAAVLHATSPREAENLRRLGLTPAIVTIPWGVVLPGEDKALNDQHEIRNGREEEENIEHRTLNVEHRTQELKCAAEGDPSSISDPRSTICDPRSAKRTALFVGRIYPVKGLPMLVEAWAKVRPVGWKMKIVGPDEAGHLAEVEALVRKAGLDDEFEFTGPLDGESLHDAYTGADLLILPSYTENFGMVVVEALAHGVPVIATQGSPWNGLLEKTCGWWPEIASDSIAGALQEATSLDPTALRQMGARGQDWMREDFSWSQTARRMAEVYRDLIAG